MVRQLLLVSIFGAECFPYAVDFNQTDNICLTISSVFAFNLKLDRHFLGIRNVITIKSNLSFQLVQEIPILCL